MKRRRRRRQNDERLKYVFEHIVELLKGLDKESRLSIGGRLSVSPDEKPYVDTMLKRGYIKSHVWDGITYYYLTDAGRKVIENSKKEGHPETYPEESDSD